MFFILIYPTTGPSMVIVCILVDINSALPLKLYFVSFYRKAPKALVFRPSLAAVLLRLFQERLILAY